MSNKALSHIERFAWVLIQSLWVGGMWLTLLIIFPALDKSVLAPILAYNVIIELAPRVILVAAICIFIQLILYIRITRFTLFFKDGTGTILLTALVLSVLFLVLHYLKLASYQVQTYLYVVISILGVFIMFRLPPWLQKQRETYSKIMDNKQKI